MIILGAEIQHHRTPPHQNSNEVSATSLSTTNGALAFLIILIMDHDPRMIADVVDGPADGGASSRHRDDTLADKSTFLPLSARSGPWTVYEGLSQYGW